MGEEVGTEQKEGSDHGPQDRQMFAMSQTDKGLVSRVHKKSLQIRKKKATSAEKLAKDMNIQFIEKSALKANRHDTILKIIFNHQRNMNLRFSTH